MSFSRQLSSKLEHLLFAEMLCIGVKRFAVSRKCVVNRKLSFDLRSIVQDNQPVLSWYSCGPTVYDDAHLGHARTYVCTDMIRRVLSVFYNKRLNFAMGITDVDDKIIAKGKSLKLKTLQEYQSLTQKLESEFFRDMADLHVQPPDAILRVTEHIDEIIAFIQVLIDKKHAYVAQDGVYFDYLSFTAKPYDRFGCQGTSSSTSDEQTTINNGNEALNHTYTTKHYAKDFALWKVFPVTEIVGWESPWGNGRPGWHIECSAMTYTYFGKSLNIHSGGIDLQFPHHTNEIAQSECHHCDQQLTSSTPDWVQHWIHTGHLHIEGRKMSKSLKNFVSIRDYLRSNISKYPADDFRIFCMQSRYSANVTYSEKRIQEAAAYRDKVQQFLFLMEGLRSQRAKAGGATYCKPCEGSKALTEKLKEIQIKVEECILDDFDTPYMLQLFSELIAAANAYGMKVLHGISLAFEPLNATEEYIRQLTQMVGLQFAKQPQESGKAVDVDETNQRLQHVLDILIDLRSGVRALTLAELKISRQNNKHRSNAEENAESSVSLCRKLLTLTDEARAKSSGKLGVQLDDMQDGSSIVKGS